MTVYGTQARAATAALLLVVAGCGAEPLTDPGESLVVRIAGATTLRVGDTLRLDATVEGLPAPGTPMPSPTWQIGDPAIAGVPAGFNPVGPAAIRVVGRAAGTVTVTATAGSASASTELRVIDERPIVRVGPGETVSGRIVGGFSRERFAVELQRGDTIDLRAVRSDSLADLDLQVTAAPFDVRPTISSGVTQIVAARVAPAAGTYLFDGTGDPLCSRGSCTPANGAFTLTVRRSGPVFVLLRRTNGLIGGFGFQPARWVAPGAVIAETLWVANVGAGSMSVAASSGNAFVSLDRSIVVARGPASGVGAPAENAPAGAAPLIARIDASGLPPGNYGAELRITMDSSTWNLLGGVARPVVGVAVHDPAVRVLSARSLDGIAAGSRGDLYGYAAGDIYRLDPSTGVATLVAQVHVGIKGLAVGPDGTLAWRHAVDGDTIYTYVPGTGARPLTGWSDGGGGAFGLAFGADGSIFTFHGNDLVRISPAGVRSTLASPGTAANPVFHPGENALYYARGGELRRFDLTALVEESRGAFAADIAAIDAQGRLYAFRNAPALYVFDTRAVLLRTVVVPTTTVDVAVVGDAVYGGTTPSASFQYFWRMPVP